MKLSDKIALAQSERRSRLAALAEKDALDDSEASELEKTTADYKAAETRYQAALISESEAREKIAHAPAELRDRISLARYLMAFAGEAQADGAEAELRQELGLSDQALPLEAMLPTVEERAAIEHRADAISPQNAAGNAALGFDTVYQTTGPLLSRVFTQTDAAFLRVSMPTVPPGERVYPVMTDGTTAAMVARGSATGDAEAATFDVVSATPHRLSGRYVFDLEGVATLGGMLESTLRADLRQVMGFQLDSQILNGDGSGANVTGIVSSLALAASPGETFSSNDISAVPDWNDWRRIAYRGLDGKYARTEADIRLLVGQDSYQLARETFRNNNAADAADAVDALRNLGATVRQSFLIAEPSVATILPKSANSAKKVQSAIVNSEPGAAVAPVWQGINMIRDPYSNASTAQIVITAHMLFDFVMRRKDGWKRYAIRTEA